MSSSFMVGKQLEANLADNAHKKATNPIIKTLFLGFLAGFWYIASTFNLLHGLH